MRPAASAPPCLRSCASTLPPAAVTDVAENYRRAALVLPAGHPHKWSSPPATAGSLWGAPRRMGAGALLVLMGGVVVGVRDAAPPEGTCRDPAQEGTSRI
jgi:hypothetical protein